MSIRTLLVSWVVNKDPASQDKKGPYWRGESLLTRWVWPSKLTGLKRINWCQDIEWYCWISLVSFVRMARHTHGASKWSVLQCFIVKCCLQRVKDLSRNKMKEEHLYHFSIPSTYTHTWTRHRRVWDMKAAYTPNRPVRLSPGEMIMSTG